MHLEQFGKLYYTRLVRAPRESNRSSHLGYLRNPYTPGNFRYMLVDMGSRYNLAGNQDYLGRMCFGVALVTACFCRGRMLKWKTEIRREWNLRCISQNLDA
jgi:hypothetical protein